MSGPMQDCTLREQRSWRVEAAATLEWLGVECFDPTAVAVAGFEAVEADKREIDASDAVLAYPWKYSVGTSMEVLYAWERGKAVVVVWPGPVADAHDWLRYHAHGLVGHGDVAGACRLLAAGVLRLSPGGRENGMSDPKPSKEHRETATKIAWSRDGYLNRKQRSDLADEIAAALARVEAEGRERAAMMAGKCGYYGLAAAIRFRGTA